MKALALLAVAMAVPAAARTEPHYEMRAAFDPAGALEADVEIVLSPGTREKTFLLSRRFELRGAELLGASLAGVTAAESPVEGLYAYRFVAAPRASGPMRLRLLYGGPINPAEDNGVRPLRDEGFELFIDHMWFPVGADIQTRFTLDAEIEGLDPDLVVVAQGEVTRSPTGVRIRRDYIDIDIPMVSIAPKRRGSNSSRATSARAFPPSTSAIRKAPPAISSAGSGRSRRRCAWR
jgi:hypothetical protein